MHSNGQHDDDNLHVYDFGQKSWTCLTVPEGPPGCRNVFVDVYEEQLLQFGGKFLPISAEEAVKCF